MGTWTVSHFTMSTTFSCNRLPCQELFVLSIPMSSTFCLIHSHVTHFGLIHSRVTHFWVYSFPWEENGPAVAGNCPLYQFTPTFALNYSHRQQREAQIMVWLLPETAHFTMSSTFGFILFHRQHLYAHKKG